MESIIPNSNGCIFSIPKSNGLHWSSGCAGKKLKKGIDFQTPMDYIPQSPKPHTYYKFQKPKDTRTRRSSVQPGELCSTRTPKQELHLDSKNQNCTSVSVFQIPGAVQRAGKCLVNLAACSVFQIPGTVPDHQEQHCPGEAA